MWAFSILELVANKVTNSYSCLEPVNSNLNDLESAAEMGNVNALYNLGRWPVSVVGLVG